MKRVLIATLFAMAALAMTANVAVAKKKKRKGGGASPQGMLKCIGKIIECGAPHNTIKGGTYNRCIKKMDKIDSVCRVMKKGIVQCLKKKKCNRKKGPKGVFCRLGCNFGGSAKKAFDRAKRCTKKCIKKRKGPKCVPACFAGLKFPKSGKGKKGGKGGKGKKGGGINQGGSKKAMAECAKTVFICGAPHITTNKSKYTQCVAKLAKIDKVCAGLGRAINACLKKQRCDSKGGKAPFCRLGCNFGGAAKAVFKRGLKCAGACIKARQPPSCVPKCFAGQNKKRKKRKKRKK